MPYDITPPSQTHPRRPRLSLGSKSSNCQSSFDQPRESIPPVRLPSPPKVSREYSFGNPTPSGEISRRSSAQYAALSTSPSRGASPGGAALVAGELMHRRSSFAGVRSDHRRSSFAGVRSISETAALHEGIRRSNSTFSVTQAHPSSRSLGEQRSVRTFRVSRHHTQGSNSGLVTLKSIKQLKKDFEATKHKDTNLVYPAPVLNDKTDNSMSNIMLFEFAGKLKLTDSKYTDKLAQGVTFPMLLKIIYYEADKSVIEAIVNAVTPKAKQRRRLTAEEQTGFEELWLEFRKDINGNMDLKCFQEALWCLRDSYVTPPKSAYAHLYTKLMVLGNAQQAVTKESFQNWWFEEDRELPEDD